MIEIKELIKTVNLIKKSLYTNNPDGADQLRKLINFIDCNEICQTKINYFFIQIEQ